MIMLNVQGDQSGMPTEKQETQKVSGIVSGESANLATQQSRSRSRLRAFAMPFAVLMVPVMAGCSSVPDAVNPVSWYEGTLDFFTGEDSDDEEIEAAAAESQPIPGADAEFPTLSSVPDRPSAAQGGTVAEGLISDPNRPRYADAVPRQGDAQLALQAVEATQATVAQGNVQPAPPAAPAAPVDESEMTNILTPPAEPTVPSAAATQTATSSPMPSILTDNSSQQAFEQFRNRLRGSLTDGQAAPMPVATGQYGGYGNTYGGAPPTVVVSSSGVSTENVYGAASQYQPGYQTQPSGLSAVASQGGFRTLDGQQGAALAPGSVKVATILFNNGSSNLDGVDQGVLQQVAQLQRQRGGFVRVIGHASSRTKTMDPVRHKMVNYSVSAGRADAVASALVRMGVPRDAILVGAVADTDPIFFEVMPSGEAGNRRTEVYLDT